MLTLVITLSYYYHLPLFFITINHGLPGASCPEGPVASPLLRAGVQEDGDGSKADLRDTPNLKRSDPELLGKIVNSK